MNALKLVDILDGPIISEKSTNSAEKENRFVFKTRISATKPQIKKVIETMFDVKVASVNVLNIKGKNKRFGKTLGKRSDWKKAYVKLQPGYDINFVTP